MGTNIDIAVIGAGPAGSNAALSAAAYGLQVALIDEQPKAGGQVWRAKSSDVLKSPQTAESLAGDALRRAVDESPITHLANTQVWHISGAAGAWTVELLSGGAATSLTAKALILATGAREYVQPVPGWTTPGVVGLAGTTALLKNALTLPSERTVVSGTGPLVFYVASEIRRLGGTPVAVVTPNTRRDWASALPAMMMKPALLARGALWLADLRLAGVPILWGHAVSHIAGTTRVTQVATQKLGHPAKASAKQGPVFVADSVCLGHGLVPQIEAAQMLGVPVRHDAGLGGWVPQAAPDGATPVAGLYLCGDGCGIRGAAAAALQGKLAGARAARDLGAHGAAPSMRPWQRAARFGKAMTAMSIPQASLEATTTDDTIICRCESLSRRDLLAEIAAGAASTNAVKSSNRAGMGPCGGKYCQTTIAAIIARQTGQPLADIPPHTPRPPLRPVPLAQAAGDFAYDELPIPKPAPL